MQNWKIHENSWAWRVGRWIYQSGRFNQVFFCQFISWSNNQWNQCFFSDLFMTSENAENLSSIIVYAKLSQVKLSSFTHNVILNSILVHVYDLYDLYIWISFSGFIPIKNNATDNFVMNSYCVEFALKFVHSWCLVYKGIHFRNNLIAWWTRKKTMDKLTSFNDKDLQLESSLSPGK